MRRAFRASLILLAVSSLAFTALQLKRLYRTAGDMKSGAASGPDGSPAEALLRNEIRQLRNIQRMDSSDNGDERPDNAAQTAQAQGPRWLKDTNSERASVRIAPAGAAQRKAKAALLDIQAGRRYELAQPARQPEALKVKPPALHEDLGLLERRADRQLFWTFVAAFVLLAWAYYRYH